MDKRELEIKLQDLAGFSSPNPELEQYRTPPELAASLLWKIHLDEGFKDKVVYDLGCGTGTLGIGAKLMGASRVICVDIDDEAVDITRSNAERLGVEVESVVSDIEDLQEEADMVVQNPPFGSQKKGNDRPFIKKSLELAPFVYSFHMSTTGNFVERFVENCGGRITYSEDLMFPLEKTMPWHSEKMKDVEVRLYRFERV